MKKRVVLEREIDRTLVGIQKVLFDTLDEIQSKNFDREKVKRTLQTCELLLETTKVNFIYGNKPDVPLLPER